jgi:hypothetical protein
MQPPPVPTPKVHALTRGRMFTAIAVAAVADILQFSFGPAGWFFFDEAIDVIAFIIVTRLIGFHWLLLPTFVLEFVPFTDMLPTWTGCVLWVLRVRNKQAAQTRVETQTITGLPPN